MSVRLKALNSRKKKLVGGRWATYWWAWKKKGALLLKGEPGSPEFIASYHAAHATKIMPAPGTMLSVLRAYEASQEFARLTERTREDYVGFLKKIEARYGSFPLALLTDRRTRGHFKGWRNELAVSSLRQADYAWSVLARVLSWALDRGLVPANPVRRAAGSTMVAVPRTFGLPKMRLISSSLARRICICRCCWRSGPGSGKVTFSVYHGQATTAPRSASSRAKPARAWPYQWASRLRMHWIALRSDPR